MLAPTAHTQSTCVTRSTFAASLRLTAGNRLLIPAPWVVHRCRKEGHANWQPYWHQHKASTPSDINSRSLSAARACHAAWHHPWWVSYSWFSHRKTPHARHAKPKPYKKNPNPTVGNAAPCPFPNHPKLARQRCPGQDHGVHLSRLTQSTYSAQITAGSSVCWLASPGLHRAPPL